MVTKPLILLHGAGGTPEIWPESLRNKKAVYAPDLGQIASQGATISDFTEELFHQLDRWSVNRGVFCGHSMGGAMALTMALTHPERVAGLILMGTGARLRVNPSLLRLLKRRWLRFMGIRKVVEASLSKEASQSVRKDLTRILKKGASHLYRDLLACDQFDLLTEVKKIHAPTLILCGLEDQLTPPKYSDSLHHQIEGSFLRAFPACGHMIPLEKPEEMVREIDQFLSMSF